MNTDEYAQYGIKTFIEQLTEFTELSDKKHRCPKWQLDICAEAYKEIKHFRQYLSLTKDKDTDNLIFVYENRRTDTIAKFKFSSTGLKFILQNQEKLSINKQADLAWVISFIINTMYDNGILLPADYKVAINTAMAKGTNNKSSLPSPAKTDLLTIRDEYKSKLLPNLNSKTIDMVSSLLTFSKQLRWCHLKVIDNGYALAFIDGNEDKVLESKIRYTTQLKTRLFAQVTLYDNGKKKYSKILTGDLENIADQLSDLYYEL